MTFVSILVATNIQPQLFSNYIHDLSAKPAFPHTTTLPL